jgi:hypothetical protein
LLAEAAPAVALPGCAAWDKETQNRKGVWGVGCGKLSVAALENALGVT